MGSKSPNSQIDRLVADVQTGERRAARRACDQLMDYWEHHDPELDDLLNLLVEAAQSGSDAALEVVLTAIHQLGLARPAITRLIIEPNAVDEVAQATLVKVEANLAKFERRSKFRTWLYSVARNEALMRLRRENGSATPNSDEVEDTATAGRRMSSIVVTRATVRDALDALAEPYRETMLLRVENELEYDEIAAHLGVPIGTVRSRLAKARTMLTERLEFT
ncbi:MAG: sigma-70 family RNA polymerase sigma factor [Acidimicrobiales bacterium]|nr:sigma-70 family RNA polymerase sigma factor [Acidimicrobiales bacterium]